LTPKVKDWSKKKKGGEKMEKSSKGKNERDAKSGNRGPGTNGGVTAYSFKDTRECRPSN